MSVDLTPEFRDIGRGHIKSALRKLAAWTGLDGSKGLGVYANQGGIGEILTGAGGNVSYSNYLYAKDADWHEDFEGCAITIPEGYEGMYQVNASFAFVLKNPGTGCGFFVRLAEVYTDWSDPELPAVREEEKYEYYYDSRVVTDSADHPGIVQIATTVKMPQRAAYYPPGLPPIYSRKGLYLRVWAPTADIVGIEESDYKRNHFGAFKV